MSFLETARLRLALLAGKVLLAASKASGRDGTLVPGTVAQRICPDILSRIDSPSRMVFVTGTNGKTTTTNLLDDIVVGCGYDIVDNRAGGNITEGIVSALVGHSRFDGTPRENLAILEIDEHHTRIIFRDIEPLLVVVTNLYRDSFVRNANPEYVMGVLSRSLPQEAHLVLNADDCLSSQLGEGRERVTYFSVGRLPQAKSAEGWVANDLPDCPHCGAPLVFDWCHLRHIGHAHCPSCGFENPDPDYEVISIDAPEEGPGSFVIRENATPGQPEHRYHITSYTVSALYNLTAAIVAARELGIAADDIASVLERGVSVVGSRYKGERVEGVELVEVLAKGWNPSACSSVMTTIRDAPGNKAVVLIIDDFRAESNLAASDFMGWTYTTDLEQLACESVRQIIVAGSRAKDYELRLLLAGVAPEAITVVGNHYDIGDAVRLDGIDRVYWAYDWESTDVIKKTHARVAERLRARAGAKDTTDAKEGVDA